MLDTLRKIHRQAGGLSLFTDGFFIPLRNYPKGWFHYPKERFYYPKGVLKDSNTIQKSSSTIQKSDSTIQKDLDPSQEIVLNYFKKHPNATIDETVAEIKDLSLGGVKFIIGKLQQKGLLKRVGGRKHGTWQVLQE